MSSQFEFLGNTLIGQYIPRNSWIHQRDPRARLIGFIILMIGVTFTPHILGLVLGFACVLGIYHLSQLPIKPAWRMYIRAFPLILILGVIQILFISQATSEHLTFNLFGLLIPYTAILNAAILILRFSVLIFLLNVIVMSISTSQVTAAIFYLLKPFENIGFPVNDLTMVIQITLRYLPLIAQISEKIAKAQASRGGDWEKLGFNPVRQAKRVLPLIIPIIVMSLKKAETMAVAMESRGFNAAARRSSYYQFDFEWVDALLLSVILSITGLMLLISWLF